MNLIASATTVAGHGIGVDLLAGFLAFGLTDNRTPAVLALAQAVSLAVSVVRVQDIAEHPKPVLIELTLS